MIPEYLKDNLGKSKVAAGLACGMLWTISKYLQAGDIVLCPNGKGTYFVGEITGDYVYQKGETLPHRRTVRWFPKTITREEMSGSLKNSAGSIGTVSDISQYANE